MSRLALAPVVALLAAACTGTIADFGGGTGKHQADPSDGGCSTEVVFNGLSTTCVACHGPDTSKPYFSSLEAFTANIASKPAWVVPGHAEASPFLQLLDGQSSGSYPQMPPNGDAFSTLSAKGATAVTRETIACWVNNLDLGGVVVTSAGPLQLVQRLRAEQLLASVSQQLGVPLENLSASAYGARATTDLPMVDPYHQQQHNFMLLGGGNFMTRDRSSIELSPTFIQSMVNISQTACRRSVNLTPSPLLTKATLSDPSATQGAKVRDNIRAMHRHLLALTATEDDVAAYYELFTTYEPKGRALAWTAVCAAMLRDPRWLSY